MMNFRRPKYIGYVFETNLVGSGKADSYVRALDILCNMLIIQPLGFEDCIDIWNITSLQRIGSKWGHPLEVSGQAAMSIPLYFYLKNQVSLLHYN